MVKSPIRSSIVNASPIRTSVHSGYNNTRVVKSPIRSNVSKTSQSYVNVSRSSRSPIRSTHVEKVYEPSVKYTSTIPRTTSHVVSNSSCRHDEHIKKLTVLLEQSN